MNIKNNIIKSFEKNKKGTDYAVGDIHGCYTTLFYTLQKIGFDKTKDRLFCVGDLCDRGAESEHVLDFLKNDWVYSVMGNHEQILFSYEAGHVSKEDMIAVGASWWLMQPKEKKGKILDLFFKLPIAIELETDYGKIGILHGECPVADWNKLKDVYFSSNRARFIERTLWGDGSPHNSSIIKNIDAIVVGHMTQNQYKIAGNVHLIDTGAVYKDGYFTILNLNTMERAYYFEDKKI